MSTILSRTTYAYDGAHNRTQKVKDGVTTNYSYNSLNQMTGFTEGDREVSFEYDDNGNRVSRTENSQTDEYSYDCENRLVGVQKGSVAYAYTYDYRTRRVERVEGNTTTKIVFSGGTSAQEYEGDNRTVEYIRGSDYGGGIGGILYTLRDGSRPSYTHYNNRGDVVAKTGPEQEVTYQASYEAFGTRTKEVGQTQDRQKANTKEEDPTGLLNEGFRYRDLETGSFIVRDPLGYKAGPNFYTYVHQNPWTKFDPEGLAEGDEKKPVPQPGQSKPPPAPNKQPNGTSAPHYLDKPMPSHPEQSAKWTGDGVAQYIQHHIGLHPEQAAVQIKEVYHMLVQEAQKPGGHPYNAVQTQKQLDALASILINRLATYDSDPKHHMTWGASKGSNITDMIYTARGSQFSGFIDASHKHIEDGSLVGQRQRTYNAAALVGPLGEHVRDFLTKALNTSIRAVCQPGTLKDPYAAQGGTYYVRTTNSAPPYPHAKALESLGGQIFYPKQP